MAGNNPEVRVQVHLEGIEEAQEALRGLNEKIAAVKALAGELAAALDKLDIQLSSVDRNIN